MEIKLKKDRMTKDERWDAILSGKKPDRIPVWGWALGFAVVNQGLSIVDFYNDPKKSYEAQMKNADKFGFQEIPYTGYAQVGGWEFGGEIKWPSGDYAQAPTVEKHPIETVEEAWNLKVPDVKTAGIVPILMDIARLVDRGGSKYIVGFVQGPFTTATNIPGAEKLVKWMIKKPDVAHNVMRLATDFQSALARYWAESFPPERLIILGAEPATSNQLISPAIFEKFALPYIKEVHENILATGIKHIHMHICGEQNENLKYWEQIPYGSPGMVSFGHEVDLESASKYFPNTIIMGNVEPAIIQTGNQEQIYEATKICINKGRKHPGGYILTPGCELPPMSPEENVWAMMQAVSDYGWYE
jgi:uroporphyrinogen decarboxylase